MQQLDDYTPTIPDSVTAHYLARSGTVNLLRDVMRSVLHVGIRIAVTSKHHLWLAFMLLSPFFTVAVAFHLLL
jgi:hypothetical protein